jgi:hypothetical protein
MNHNYYNKYKKYKIKYINLLKKMNGGNRQIFNEIIYKFFDRYFNILIKTEYYSRFIFTKYINKPKYLKYGVVDITQWENLKKETFIEDIFENILSDLYNFLTILYSRINDADRKHKITIFSYSTGSGFVEALFAIYLKIIKRKEEVQIICFDPFMNIDLINEYITDYGQIFDYSLDLLRKIKTSDEDILKSHEINIKQLELLHDKLYKEGEYVDKKIIDKFIDPHLTNIDIFLAFNGQVLTYNFNGRINPSVLIANLYINLITMNEEEQKKIPMFWIYFSERLDFSSIDTLYGSMMEINYEYMEKSTEYSLSTLDNLYRIGGFNEPIMFPKI